MDSISISKTNTDSAVSGLINRIQTHIINASKISGNTIINAAEFSSGDFINALREEVEQEVMIMNSVGELLIAMANYIQSAATAFTDVDNAYNTSKVK